MRFSITTGGNGAEQQINGASALPACWLASRRRHAGWHHLLDLRGRGVGGTNTITITPSQLGSTTQNCIGRSQWTPDPYLNGQVDDFRIYNGALSAAQIAALAASLSGATARADERRRHGGFGESNQSHLVASLARHELLCETLDRERRALHDGFRAADGDEFQRHRFDRRHDLLLRHRRRE